MVRRHRTLPGAVHPADRRRSSTPDVRQLHSADYRRPGSHAARNGSWSSAPRTPAARSPLELSATRTVELAVGQRMPTVPQRPLGRDVWWWASGLGLDRVTADSRLGRRLAGRDQVDRGRPATARPPPRRPDPAPRRRRAAGRTVTFADGDAAEYDAVVWATGFTHRRLVDRRPRRHRRAGTHRAARVASRPRPGLYTLGLTWQHTRASALLGWVRKRRGLPRRADRGPRSMKGRIQARPPAPPRHRRACRQPADAGLSRAGAGHDDGRGHPGTR